MEPSCHQSIQVVLKLEVFSMGNYNKEVAEKVLQEIFRSGREIERRYMMSYVITSCEIEDIKKEEEE